MIIAFGGLNWGPPILRSYHMLHLNPGILDPRIQGLRDISRNTKIQAAVSSHPQHEAEAKALLSQSAVCGAGRRLPAS